MDQTFVSGLGNIYVNETLFMSKIYPLRACSSLNIKEIKNLIFNIKKILKFSISKGGSSIRDFKNTLGKSGNFQQFFHVYGQKNNKKFTNNFDIPTKLEQILFTKNEYNHLEFTFNRSDNKFVDGFILLQWKYGRKHAAIETRYTISL